MGGNISLLLFSKEVFFMDDEKNIPYGILKQAFMKLESFTEDMHECLNYDMSEEDKYECTQMMEVATTMSMRILNIVRQGMNEEDFINEKVNMDTIGQFPEHSEEIEDIEI